MLAPALLLAAAQPGAVYLLPAPGRVLRVDPELGAARRGLVLATAPAAPVAAPARGWVAYVGRFRGLGRVVILDHGHGWTTLLAGLDALDVRAGMLAERGAVVGRMAQRRARLTIELRHHGRLVDPARLRGPVRPITPPHR